MEKLKIINNLKKEITITAGDMAQEEPTATIRLKPNEDCNIGGFSIIQIDE